MSGEPDDTALLLRAMTPRALGTAFAAGVRRERLARGWSYTQLCAASGIARGSLASVELHPTGTGTGCGVGMAIALAAALGKTVEELVTG